MLSLHDYSEYSATELVRLLGQRFRDYRLRARMTQKEVANMAGVTIPTVHRFENGWSGSISLSTFLLLLKAIDSTGGLDALMPEQPESPYLINSRNHKAQRVRHKLREQ